MDDLAQREEERRKRREERERAKKAEEDAWEAERKKREEERKARRETRLKGESVEAEPKPKMTDIIEREEEEKRKALEEEKRKRVEEANALAESRKNAPVQETPQQPVVKRDEPKVEIKPRIEKLEKITKGEEEEHQVKPTVNIKLETKDLNIKPTIEYMEKISSPRSNTSDPVSPRKKEESPKPSPVPTPSASATKEDDSDDDSSSYTSSSSVSSDSEDDVDDKKKIETKAAAEQEIKKALEEEEKKLKAKEEAEKKAKAEEEEEKKKKLALEEEEEKKKKAQYEEEEKKKKLALEEEEKKRKLALEEEEKKKKALLLEEEEKKKKKLALEEEEKKRRAKEEEDKKKKLEEEKKKSTNVSTTTATAAVAVTPSPQSANTSPSEFNVIDEDREEDFTLYKKLSEKELQSLENSYSQRKIAENAKKEPQQTAFYATHLAEFFHSFTSLCRDISSQYDVPELVFIGSKGQGKSNLVASILGVPISYDTLEKPIYFHLLSDPNVAKYSYSVENTNNSGEYFNFTNVVDFQNKLRESIKEKGKSTSINVKISSSLVGFNITLIDTPYLHHVQSNDKLVLDLIKDQSRTIIYVKEATVEKDHNFLLELKQLLNSVDPKFSRTILVNTKLDNTLKLRLLTNQINDALESSLKFPGNTFWVSALTSEATSSIKTEEEYKERLAEVQKIDIKILESLKYNKRVASIGLSLLRSNLLNLCWNQYKVNIPKMQQKNKDAINKLLNSQRVLNSQLEKLTSDKLRYSVNNYYHSFLIQLKKLLEGNEKVQSPMIGQTLSEEYSQTGFYWEVPDSLDSTINSTTFKEKVPLYSSRLNGAHQFKRLLSEFQLVLDQIKLPNVSIEDIVCAGAGVLQSSNSSFLYAACEYTRSEAYSLLQPLVLQLAERAVNILNRQTHVVDSILRSNDSPYLVSYLDSIFHAYFDEMGRNFLAKINEEFYSTATLYWSSLLHDKDATDQDISQYSNNLFNNIKNHIATKSLLLLTNYFVFSVLENSEALENLQLKLFKLSDQDITELFQVNNTKSNLLQEDNDITEKVKVLESFNQQISNKLVYWPKAS